MASEDELTLMVDGKAKKMARPEGWELVPERDRKLVLRLFARIVQDFSPVYFLEVVKGASTLVLRAYGSNPRSQDMVDIQLMDRARVGRVYVDKALARRVGQSVVNGALCVELEEPLRLVDVKEVADYPRYDAAARADRVMRSGGSKGIHKAEKKKKKKKPGMLTAALNFIFAVPAELKSPPDAE